MTHTVPGAGESGAGTGASSPGESTTLDAAHEEAERRMPGRPRSVRADEAIIEAVLDLLADGTTVEAMSIEAVAARAGVGKATIYRRWPNKESLVVDAIGALKGPPPDVTGETLRDDLLTLLSSTNKASASRAGRIMPCLIPELQRNPELHRQYQRIAEPRRERMREVLRRGIADGVLRADLDIEVTATLLSAPMLVQNMLNWNPGLDNSKLPEQIVDAMLPGMLA
jgi:AcrR family transcriptional regulator